MTGKLEGRVSLVTGASRGIGRAIARALALEGAFVFVGARDEGRLAEVVRECADAGGTAVALALDVSDSTSVDAAVQKILEAQGRVDHLVNNAGITRDNLLLRMKKEEWDDVLATNLTGTYLCTQAVLKPMLKQRSGRIVNVTSVVGLTGNAGQANYAASKAGIIGFTKAVAREVAVLLGRSGRAAGHRRAVVVEDLAARAAGSRVAHHPEVVRRIARALVIADAHDALGRQADHLQPDVVGLVVLGIDGGPRAFPWAA